MDAADVVEFRPGFGRGMTWVTGALCAVALGATAWGAPHEGLRVAPVLAFVSTAVWALFGRPAVVVTPAGVEVRNVLRTIDLPWPSIQRIDTKYALTLFTTYGSYAAWAAPAPSRARTLQAGPDEVARTSEARAVGVRPGDLANSASGQAAAYIRRRWDELREAGVLDRPRLERDRPRVQWHVATIVAAAVLGVLSALSLSL